MGRTLFWTPSALFGMLMLLALASTGHAIAADDKTAAKLIAVTDAGPVYLQPLDAPGNPYAGQYSDYDRWVYENALMMPEEDIRRYYDYESPEAEAWRQALPQDWQLLEGFADQQGFLLPELVVFARRTEQHNRPADWALEYFDTNEAVQWWEYSDLRDAVRIWAAGVPETAMMQAYYTNFSELQSAEYPPIPAWLGEQPPLEAIFVPNGEILCHGPLGLKLPVGEDSNAWRFQHGELLWYRYSAEGRRLGTFDFPSPYSPNWTLIYWPGQTEQLQSLYTDNVWPNSRNGVLSVVLHEPETLGNDPGSVDYHWPRPLAVLACFDYDGTPLDPQAVLPAWRMNQGNALPMEIIAQAYQQQLDAGLTSRDSLSPFAGTAEGPSVFDDKEDAGGLYAHKGFTNEAQVLASYEVNDGRPKYSVKVRRLDDPDNPYRDQYGPWDSWLLAQQGQRNSREEERWAELDQQRAELRAAAEAEGREYTEEEKLKLDPGYYAPDPGDPWEYFEVVVDPDGWVIPLLETEQREYQPHLSWDLREALVTPGRGIDFIFQAGGVMPADMRRRLEAARARLRSQGKITVPDWLIAQPVGSAAFAPNGDIITFGPLASIDPALPAEPPEARQLPSYVAAYYRYDSSGNLLGTLPAAANPSTAIFDITLLQRWEEASAIGQGCYEMYGVFQVTDPLSGSTLAAYDWDGTRLDVTQPLLPRLPFFDWFSWEDLQALYDTQQEAKLAQSQ